MSYDQCRAVVDGFVARMEAKAPDQLCRDAYVVGALSMQAKDWLYELEQLKSDKLKNEMDQLQRRLEGKDN